jgi:AcrR family transcriptional regulator
MVAVTVRSPGRPRSEAARHAILGAATALIDEQGYGATTMEGIARRAAVSKQTIYRWWPSPAAIVLEALNEGASRIAPVAETSDLDHDLRLFVRRSVLGARGKVARLLTALMAEAQRDESFAESFREGFLAQRRAVMRELLHRARSRGQLQPTVDIDFLIEMFYGALWYRLLAASGPINQRFADDLTDSLLVLAQRGQ